MTANTGVEISSASMGVQARLLDFACLIGAFVLWIYGLNDIDVAAMTDLGLASILPATLWAAGSLAILGFALSLRPATLGGPLPFMHLAMLILVLHATPAIAYETLRYSWAWKHLGIVDFIQRHGAVDPDAAFLSAYHNWPGFFALSAMAANLFKLNSVALAEIVRFFPVVLNLVLIALLPLVYRRLTMDRRLIWTATAIFVVGNWVGQDYFSPQGTVYACYLGMLALCLGPLSMPFHPAGTGLLGRFRTWVPRGEPASMPTGKWTRLLASLGVLLLILAIVVTHQLMPLLVILALAALAVLGRLSFGFLLFAIAAETLWLFYFADVYVSAVFRDLVADFGQLNSEIVGKMVDFSVASPGQRLVSLASRGLTGAIGVLAISGGLRRLWHGHRDATAIALTLVPFLLLIATSYGGEIVFRLYYYSLPFLAFFAGALFFPIASSRTGLPALLLAGLLMLLATGFILANNGKDRQYHFTPQEVAAASWLYEAAPDGALIIEGARNYPSQFMNYERFTFVPLAEEEPEDVAALLADPAAVLGRWLQQWPTSGFIILTHSQKAYLDDVGVMPVGTLDTIKVSLLSSARFRLVYANDDSSIFTLNPALTEPGNR
ncbi:hypothetical protein [Devosia yakushimensis]|nr:hypothetical protein [Devosia yakushimensis]